VKTTYSSHVAIDNLRNTTLLGQSGGSTKFIFKNCDLVGIRLNACENVVLKDISIDYDPKPFTQGRVVEDIPPGSDTNTLSVVIDGADGVGYQYRSPEDPIFDPAKDERIYRNHIYFFTATDNRSDWDPTKSRNVMYNAIQKETISGTVVYKFTATYTPGKGGENLKDADKSGQGIKIGTRVAIVPRYGVHAITAYEIDNCTFDGLRILSSPGHAFYQYTGSGSVVKNCTIANSLPSDLISVNIDGFRFGNCRTGPKITHCNLSRSGDNLIALSPDCNTVVHSYSGTDGKFVYISNPSTAGDLQDNDEVEFFDADGKRLGSGYKIIAPLRFFRGSEKVKGSGTVPLGKATYEVRLNKAAPAGAQDMKGLGGMCEGFLVNSCTLSDNRGTSIASRAWSGTISNSTILRGTNHGIALFCADRAANIWSKDVVIRSNTIDGITTGCSILVWSGKFYPDSNLDILHGEIKITKNKILNASAICPTMLVDNVDKVAIAENQFISVSTSGTNLSLSQSVRNALEDLGPETDACIMLDMATQTVVHSTNESFAQVAGAGFSPWKATDKFVVDGVTGNIIWW
jgi:hypothetical protein